MKKLRQVLAHATRGRGHAAVVVGPAGIGKTSLLKAASQYGSEIGMTPLLAKANDLEEAYPFGVTLQLLDPLLRSLDEADRDSLFTGSAQLVQRLFQHRTGPKVPGADTEFATLHGIYWLIANLAERSPLVLLVDDAQWLDAPSMRMLSFLVRRLDRLPVAVVLSARTGPYPMTQTVEALVGPHAHVVPKPLTAHGVASVLSARLPNLRADLVDACLHSTGGNPFYLQALIYELQRNPVSSDAPSVDACLAPTGAARTLRSRLQTFPRVAQRLAEAVSVLSGEPTLQDASAVAELTRDTATTAMSLLCSLDVLTSVPHGRVTFVHPIVRAAIHDQLDSTCRGELHRRAARMRLDSNAPVTHVAAHLLHCPPDTVGDAATVLEAAASQALDDGAPELAATYLRRALDETSGPAHRARLAAALGRAATRAGSALAESDQRSAMDLATSPEDKALIASDLAELLLTMGRSRDAIDALVVRAEACAADNRTVAQRLTSEALAIGDIDLAVRAEAIERVRGLRMDVVVGQGQCVDALELAHRATQVTMSCGSAKTAARLARDALSKSQVPPTEGLERQLFSLLCYLLMCADEFEEAERHLDATIEASRSAGSATGYATASAWRSIVAMRRGDLRLAEEQASNSLEVAAHMDLHQVDALALMALCLILVERGDAERASKEYTRASLPLTNLSGFMQAAVLHARANIRSAQGDNAGSLIDNRRVGESLTGVGLDNPACFAWRSAAAVDLFACGDVEAARELATAELGLARRWGAPRSVGLALRTLARVSNAEDQLGLLQTAAKELEASPARLEHGRILIALGASLRRSGSRVESRRVLRLGLDLAAECGADGDAKQARSELRIAGGRPRSSAKTPGPMKLTASEQRVARLAAQGKSNPAIAQELFLSAKTVEMHLSSAYRKLDIHSRADLPHSQL